MTRTRATSPLTGRISALLPALAALTLGWTTQTAHADLATARASLQAVLDRFADQRVGPGATAASKTPSTAIADDLVYAVYELAQNSGAGGYTTAELVQAALDSGRTDVNVVAGRVVGAAIVGAGLETSSTGVQAVVDTAENVGSLTAAGKELVITHALENTVGLGTTLGAEAVALGGTTTTSIEAFAIGSLRAVGTATADVDDFAKTVLSSVTSTDRNAAATAIAVGIASNPAAAGAVIGGRAAEIKADSPTTANADIQSLLSTLLLNTSLVSARSAFVGDAAASFTGDKQALATALVNSVISSRPLFANTSLKASVTSGIIQSFGPTVTQNDVTTLVNNVYPLHPVAKVTGTAVDLLQYAAGSAANTGDSAGLLASAVGAKITGGGSPNAAILTLVGEYVARSVAVTSPTSTRTVGVDLINSAAGAVAFSSNAAKTNLAVGLAKSVATNGIAAGAAVAGVASKLDAGAPSLTSLVAIAKATIPVAYRSGSNITMDLTALLPVTTDATTFAKTLSTSGLNLAYVPVGVAGVAAAVPANAGALVKAVIQQNSALGVRAYAIATAAASKLDVERINDVAQNVASLLKPLSPAGTGLPRLGTVGTLALDLGRVINSTPFVPTVNRADEIGELAAVLTNAVVANLPAGTANATYVSLLHSVAASLFNAVTPVRRVGRFLIPVQNPNGGTAAADRKDELGDIVGSILQSIAVNSSLTYAQKTALLSKTATPGTLYYSLLVAATVPYRGLVTDAFTNVLSTGNGTSYGIYVDPVASQNETLSNGATGKYEIGNVFETETDMKNTL